MGVTERIWSALTSMIKLEDKVTRQSEAIKAQQMKIENLTERIIRLETALEIGLARSGATPTQLGLANKTKRLPPKAPSER
jgi:hypothetical protein